MWNTKIANEQCNKLERFRFHREHLERLMQVRGKIDNKTPLKPKFLIVKPAKIETERMRLKQIDYENRIIYDRMHSISTKHSPYSIEIARPIYCPAFDKATFNWIDNKKKLDIVKRNQWLMKRFDSARSHYPTKNYLKQNEFNKYLERNLHKNNSNPNLNYVTFRKFKSNLQSEIFKERISKRAKSSIGFRKPPERPLLRSQSAGFLKRQSI